jgi:hypothetical protein
MPTTLLSKVEIQYPMELFISVAILVQGIGPIVFTPPH